MVGWWSEAQAWSGTPAEYDAMVNSALKEAALAGVTPEQIEAHRESVRAGVLAELASLQVSQGCSASEVEATLGPYAEQAQEHLKEALVAAELKGRREFRNEFRRLLEVTVEGPAHGAHCSAQCSCGGWGDEVSDG